MPRKAFTLVELLSVIGIIGVLVALLLPAVQMVRESGRRTTCSNKIRQLALGLISFEAAHNQLPVGLRSFETSAGSPSSSKDYYGMTWITRVLPFVEQTAMWDQAVEDYGFNPIPFRGHRGMQTVLHGVECPSDPSIGEPPVTAVVKIDGDLVLGEETTGHVELINQSNQPAKIIGMSRSCRCFELANDPIEMVLSAQQRVSLPLVIKPKTVGPLHQRVELFLDHPNQFRVNVDVLGSVYGVQ